MNSMRLEFRLVLVCCGMSFQICLAEVHYVNATNPSPSPPFLTPTSAATNIQAAVSVANPGDAVLVGKGTYYENVSFLGKTISLVSEGGPFETVIDGQYSNSVVTFAGGEGSNTLLAGFTITNGYAPQGGGIFCTNASPVISNCLIVGNSTFSAIVTNELTGEGTDAGSGGGVYACASSAPLIVNCVVSGNITGSGGEAGWYWKPLKAGDGGGICCYSVSIWGTLIISNGTGRGQMLFTPGHAGNGGRGGGVFCVTGNIQNCRIAQNWTGAGGQFYSEYPIFGIKGGTGGHGGGVFCRGATIRNTLIEMNSTGDGGYTFTHFQNIGEGDGGSGGGLYSLDTSIVEGCSITSNRTGDGGGSKEWSGGKGGDGAGVFALSGAPLVFDCAFTNNSTGCGGGGADDGGGDGGDGGGLCAGELCVPSVNFCSFLNNSTGSGGTERYNFWTHSHGGSGGKGGGVHCQKGTVWNSVFQNNRTGDGGEGTAQYPPVQDGGPGGDGGAVYARGAATIQSCLVVSNGTGSGAPGDGNGGDGGKGGGIWIAGGAIVNCTLWGNTVGSGSDGGALPYLPGANGTGGGVWATNGVVLNSVLWSNQTDQIDGSGFIVGYSDVQSAAGEPRFDAVTCISVDPLFVNTGWGNYRLRPESPCINAGNNAYVEASVDLDGNPRISGGGVDIGAYEFVFTPSMSIVQLMLIVENSALGDRNKQPLLASLGAAMASFDRGNFRAGANQLAAFQNQVRAQVAPFDNAVANELIARAQQIIQDLSGVSE